MQIRIPEESELESIKQFVDSFEEMDTNEDTFSIEYYKRILHEEILFIADDGTLKGVCFGKYNKEENWADLLGLVANDSTVKKDLLKHFESVVQEKGCKHMYYYADKSEVDLFKDNSYEEGKTFTAFTKEF